MNLVLDIRGSEEEAPSPSNSVTANSVSEAKVTQ